MADELPPFLRCYIRKLLEAGAPTVDLARVMDECKWTGWPTHRVTLRPGRRAYQLAAAVYREMLAGLPLRRAVARVMGYRYRRLENAFQDLLLTPECKRRRIVPLPYNIWEYAVYLYYSGKKARLYEVRVQLPLGLECTIQCAEAYWDVAERLAEEVADRYIPGWEEWFELSRCPWGKCRRRKPHEGLELVAVLECRTALDMCERLRCDIDLYCGDAWNAIVEAYIADREWNRWTACIAVMGGAP